MRVRITAKAGYSNPKRELELAAGATADVSDDLGVKLCSAGIAVPVRESPIQRAVRPAPAETTAKKPAKKVTK